MKRYWKAITKNATVSSEKDSDWNEVKNDLRTLEIISHDHEINGKPLCIYLPPSVQYTQGKTASANLGTGKVVVESRYIGFVLGNNLVKIRLHENKNLISVEVEDKDKDGLL